MTMHAPSHPGEIVREEVIAPLGLGVTKAAEVLGVTRPTLSRLLNERAALSPEMALRIEKAFGPKADHLLRMQLNHDIALARREADKLQVSDEYAPKPVVRGTFARIVEVRQGNPKADIHVVPHPEGWVVKKAKRGSEVRTTMPSAASALRPTKTPTAFAGGVKSVPLKESKSTAGKRVAAKKIVHKRAAPKASSGLKPKRG